MVCVCVYAKKEQGIRHNSAFENSNDGVKGSQSCNIYSQLLAEEEEYIMSFVLTSTSSCKHATVMKEDA